MFRKLLLTAAMAVSLAAPAAASNFTVTGYTLADWPTGNNAGTVNGYNYYAGPVLLHIASQADILAYCADLNHVLQSNSLYTNGTLTQNGSGLALSLQTSNIIGQIAQIGFAGDANMQAAAQLAIW